MLRFLTRSATAVLLTFVFTVSTTNADVIFNLGPESNGVAPLEIIGSGVLVSAGAPTGGFGGLGSAPDDLFINTGFDDNVGITLGGQPATSILVGGGLFALIFSDGPVADGTPLSDLDGNFLIDVSNASLVPGQFQFQTPFGGSDDVGLVTLNVVPEPVGGGTLLLTFASLAIFGGKRRRLSC